jgi:hypothetical protein
MSSFGYFCIVLIADIRLMSKTSDDGRGFANVPDAC